MIGNDIIDLQETMRTTNWKRSGFLKKIFTEKEQHIIAVSDNSFLIVWQLWSMKESAYKVFIQAGGKPFYNPRRLECSLKSGYGEVSVESIILKTETISNTDYIFSVAKKQDAEVKNGVFNLAGMTTEKQSTSLKQEFIKDFSFENGLNVEVLSIRKSGAGVPRLFDKDTDLDISFSLSHHGKYASYSILN